MEEKWKWGKGRRFYRKKRKIFSSILSQSFFYERDARGNFRRIFWEILVRTMNTVFTLWTFTRGRSFQHFWRFYDWGWGKIKMPWNEKGDGCFVSLVKRYWFDVVFSTTSKSALDKTANIDPRTTSLLWFLYTLSIDFSSWKNSFEEQSTGNLTILFPALRIRVLSIYIKFVVRMPYQESTTFLILQLLDSSKPRCSIPDDRNNIQLRSEYIRRNRLSTHSVQCL